MRNDDIRERLKVEHITERCRKARLMWFGHVRRRNQDYKTMSEEIPLRWYHIGEEKEEDRNRDGWTVSTET